MATVKSTRIINLQATSPRVMPVSLPASTVITGASPGGSTLGAVSTTAANAQSTASAAQILASGAYTGLSYKLNNNAIAILGGGLGFKTAGFDSGTGFAITDTGVVGIKANKPTFTLDNAGNSTYAGVVDCGAGAVIRTPNLAVFGSELDLVKFELQDDSQFGAIKQASVTVNGFTVPVGAVTFNFSVPGSYAGASIGATNTATGDKAYLSIIDSGNVVASHYTAGSWYHESIPKINGMVQTSLNADLLDGYHAGNSAGQIPVSNNSYCANLYAASSYTTYYLNAPANGAYMTLANTQSWTGSSTATWAGTNKPGSSTNISPIWLTIVVNGSSYCIPMWAL